jgi:hypothetical protein
MRWPSAWLVVSSVALLAAGCGSSSSPPRAKPPPRIPAAVAEQLASDADAVAASSGCAGHAAAVKLFADARAEIGSVPSRYQEQLMGAANDIAGGIPACPPPKPKGAPGHPKHHHDHHGDGDNQGEGGG